VTEALYTLHRSGSVIMLIYEKIKETTAHLPSDRPIKNRHLEVTIRSSMKNVIFTSLFPYTLGFPYLRVHVYVVWSMKNLNFTQKMDKRLREKKKHLRLNIPFSGFSYGNSLYISFASRRTYCYMVSALNSLYNAMKIFWLKSSRISYFYKNVELTLSYDDQ
jgi:hypothetical protein